MPIYRDTIRAAIVAAIIAANTLAGDKVFSPQDVPTNVSALPLVIVSTPSETKEAANGNMGAPAFHCTATYSIVARTADDKAGTAEAMAEQLASQIQIAILTTPAIVSLVEQVVSLNVDIALTPAGAQRFAEVTLTLVVRYYEEFWPTGAVPLVEIDSTVTSQSSGGTLALFQTPIPQAAATT